ncbi:MAG: aminotransferase class V-fold PLP-dependent enzyme [Thermaerobacter sp.]|nr:aminotransferase class V-fold PLP-dependent enzyme [Thermaerobacter sp.]
MPMSSDRPEELALLAAIREEIPAVSVAPYLNCGTAGPLPRRAVDAMQSKLAEELNLGRIRPTVMETFHTLREELRQTLARRLHCDEGEVALTGRTTDGMNIALWGLSLLPGDEVLTTRHEHNGLLVPLAALARARGVAVRYVDWPQERPDLAIEAFERAITSRTRLLAFSHVLWTNGAVLPVREIAERAHAAAALVLIDGAQSAGAVPLDLSTLGADFYSLPGQKWLMGPEGTGALYAARDAQALCHPTFTGYLSTAGVDPNAANFLPSAGARRYEVGSGLPAALVGQLESLRWQETVGEDWALGRIAALAHELREAVVEIPGIDVLSPEGQASGIVSFRIPGISAPDAAKRLHERGLLVRFLPEPHAAVRVSAGFYVLREELARLVDAVRELADG